MEDLAHLEVDHAKEEGNATFNQLKAVGRQVDQLQRGLALLQDELVNPSYRPQHSQPAQKRLKNN
ncbi:hypothetical protein [Pseudomonas syringae]|uniref:hypothetical protein n=1 Tax=Pseudomonas syringae TaxID=317 RepID=UPI001F274630|nr:hypothetical protein [Pseudomonas syringae]